MSESLSLVNILHDISQQIAELDRRLTVVEGQLKANSSRSSLENHDSVRPPNVAESSLTDRFGVAETSKVATPSPNYIYYRIYADDGAIPSKTPVAPGYPFVGRIKVRSVPPPRNAKAVKCRIIKVENIKLDDGETSLFLTPYSPSPLGNADMISTGILNGTGPGSTPQEPLVLVAKMSNSERYTLESDGRGGLASAAEADTRYVYYLLYANGEEMPSKMAIDPEEPSLGRIRVDSIAPPHCPTSIKQCISRVESNPALALWHINLFVDISCETPFKEGHISLLTDGPGLSSNEPMAIVLTPPIPGPDGKYLIKNRAADIYWEAGYKPIKTVYFYPTTMENARKNNYFQWDITHDTDGNISMTSPYAPLSWAGADLAGSTVPVPWRLIPADGKFYYLTTDVSRVSQNPQVPAAQSQNSQPGNYSPGTMATLKEGDQWQMWEFIPVNV